MPMQAESLEVLENASVAPAQARAIVRAIEIEIAGAKDTLATKHDLLLLRQDFDALRVDLRGEMTKLDSGLRGEMTKLDVELRGELVKLGAKFDVDLARGLAEVRAQIAISVGGITRQMYMALLGHMAMTLGFIYFLNTQLR